MRILTFLHSFELGGVERIALRLIQRWRELGIDAPLFLGRADGKMREDVGSAIEWIAPPPRIPTAGWQTVWMIYMLPRTVRQLRPDVLFCAGNTYTVVAIALKLLLGRDCPPILAKISNNLDRHDLPVWRRWPYRLWLRVQGRFLDHLIGMEHPMVGEIQDAMRIPAERITIVPDPALSLQLIDRLRAAPVASVEQRTGRRFVAIGRLTSQKNVALMLRAFHRGAIEGDTLTIIGDGPDRQKLTKLAAELGLGERVEFRGYVSEPSVLLPEFDIFLLSSNYEGVPAVILEALAARLTIIATNCSRSMAPLLQFGQLGKLVAVSDELELAAAIAEALPGSSNDALSLAQVQRFTLEHSAEAYLRTMNRLVLHAPSAPRFAAMSRRRGEGAAGNKYDAAVSDRKWSAWWQR